MSRAPALRAPEGDGAILVAPSLDRVAEFFPANCSLPPFTFDFAGLDGAELRGQARHDIAGSDESTPIIAAGHQPELFHPGVWLKNFVLAGLADHHQARAVNVVIDNDIIKSAAIPVPVLTDDASTVRTASIAIDRVVAGRPFEEQSITNEAEFGGFGERIAEAARDWPFEPFAQTYWSRVRESRSQLLSERLAEGRRAWERKLGVHNHELPLSELCSMPAMNHFMAGLLLEMSRLHAIYNEETERFRKVHRVRSRNHPAPNLGFDDGWYEAPFWGWRSGASRRERLWVRRDGDNLRIRAGKTEWPPLVVSRAAADLKDLGGDGFKIRPRALITTLFLRGIASDLFVHGLGGGIYDELTDAIVCRLLGRPMPRHLIVTGTLRLPFPRFAGSDGEVQKLRHQLRDCQWNPQRHLPPTPNEDARRLLTERQVWLDKSPTTRRERRERAGRLRQIVEQLREFEVDSEKLRREATAIMSAATANRLLARRDYSAILYPESKLFSFLSRGLEIPSAAPAAASGV